MGFSYEKNFIIHIIFLILSLFLVFIFCYFCGVLWIGIILTSLQEFTGWVTMIICFGLCLSAFDCRSIDWSLQLMVCHFHHYSRQRAVCWWVSGVDLIFGCNWLLCWCKKLRTVATSQWVLLVVLLPKTKLYKADQTVRICIGMFDVLQRGAFGGIIEGV